MMRLTCPECAAQYEIADGLIPPEGREVECSACGHGWHQPGVPTLVLTAEAAVDDDLAAAGDLPLPPAPRGLADPVFAILREEAERELSARAEERAGRPAPLVTGIADPTPRAMPAAPEPALPDPLALAASLQWEVPPRPREEAMSPPSPVPPPALPPAPGAATAAAGRGRAAAAAASQRRRAHDRGFAVALLASALLAGAYVLAPSLAGHGAAGVRLMQAREAADEGRLWLQARAEFLADGAIAGLRGLAD